MTPEQLIDEIRTKLDKRDSRAIVALSVLLPRKYFPPVDHLHCIRCHKKFRPSENGNCIMKHPTVKVLKIGQDRHGADFKCAACTTTFRLNQMYFLQRRSKFILKWILLQRETHHQSQRSFLQWSSKNMRRERLCRILCLNLNISKFV